MIFICILILILAIEIKYSPRLGYTRERNILLWYTDNYERKYITLFKL